MDTTTSDPGRPGPQRLAQPDLPGRPCSIARALDLVGEKWSLLAIREISFGNRRFNEIARNTGAPRDRLAARLHGLVDAGILERREYQAAPRREEYHLTEAGRDLVPVLRALLAWGDRWVSDPPPARLMHGDHELDPVQVCRHCGDEAPGPVTLQVNSPGWDVRGPLAAGNLAATTAAWDTELAAGSYAADPPRDVAGDIITAAAQCGLRHGLYIGCCRASRSSSTAPGLRPSSIWPPQPPGSGPAACSASGSTRPRPTSGTRTAGSRPTRTAASRSATAAGTPRGPTGRPAAAGRPAGR